MMLKKILSLMILLPVVAFAQQAPKVGVPFVTIDQYKPIVGKYGGRLVRTILGEPKSFNPITENETSSSDFTVRIFEGLTYENAFTGANEPWLAESWSVSDDGLTWIFKLRKDVLFNDGTPFMAADVVFTWNDLVNDMNRPASAKDPRWPCGERDITNVNGKPIKAELVDDYTVKFITPSRIALLDRFVGFPVICSKKKCEQSVADGTFGGSMSSDSKPEDVVGTGPWMLGSYERGSRVTLKRNPHYWRKDAAGNALPYLDEMVFLVVRDFNADLLNFQQKITDVYTLTSGKDVPLLRPQQTQDNFTLYQCGPDFGENFLALNMNEDAAKQGKIAPYKVEWFRDVRFRKAISYAIDRKAIVQNVLRNLGYAQAAPFTLAEGPYKVSGIEPYPHDPEKAKALLADMGLKDRDGSGVLSDDQGRKVAFTLTTNAENNTRLEMMDFIRKDLQSVGMDVNVLPLEFNQLIDKMDNTFEWETMILGFTGTREPEDGANIWRSSSYLHAWWPSQKTPSFPWEKRIDEIYADAMQEMDINKRKQLFTEWVHICIDQQPMVWLAERERVIALRNKFGNIFPSPQPGAGAPEDPLLHNEFEIFVK
jgi:peptide/nickel transport system substrate-binding protein